MTFMARFTGDASKLSCLLAVAIYFSSFLSSSEYEPLGWSRADLKGLLFRRDTANLPVDEIRK